MLWQVGPLVCDTFPFEVSEVKEKVTADFAKHDLIATRRDYEFSGVGDEPLSLSGQLLPFHIGGLSELELAKRICRSGEPQFVMRGDGYVQGWYQVMTVESLGKMLGPTGVGYVMTYQIDLERVDDPGEAAGADLIATLVSLFG